MQASSVTTIIHLSKAHRAPPSLVADLRKNTMCLPLHTSNLALALLSTSAGDLAQAGRDSNTSDVVGPLTWDAVLLKPDVCPQLQGLTIPRNPPVTQAAKDAAARACKSAILWYNILHALRGGMLRANEYHMIRLRYRSERYCLCTTSLIIDLGLDMMSKIVELLETAMEYEFWRTKQTCKLKDRRGTCFAL